MVITIRGYNFLQVFPTHMRTHDTFWWDCRRWPRWARVLESSLTLTVRSIEVFGTDMKTFNQQLLNTGIGTQQSIMSIEKIYVMIQTLTLSYDHLNPKLYIYTITSSHYKNHINGIKLIYTLSIVLQLHNYTKITLKITQHGKIQLVLTLALKHYPFIATLYL